MERADLTQWLWTEGCVVERNGFVFLCDPNWSPAERDMANALFTSARGMAAPDDGWLCLRTGGSGGGLKFARHDEQTLGAAVRGFCSHFGLGRVNAVGVLPTWHVSGLMGRVRCHATGGTFINGDWKALERGEFPVVRSSGDWVLSLVPTQMQRLLGSPAAVEWLRRFAIIFLGGGPTWPALADAAGAARLPVSLSYGMTETAAMVTAQHPAEFLGGDRSAGSALPHARVRITGDGHVGITAESLFRGYFPEHRVPGEFVTQDLGELDAKGRLYLSGRSDAVIITGGKKVQPVEVEAALRASGEFADVAVVGVPDSEWGEVVVACYPPAAKEPDLARAVSGLPAHQRPKHFVVIANWPRNPQGKIDRTALRETAARATD